MALDPPSNDIRLFVALTRLDKANGMFSFLEKPEDEAIPQSEWAEEKVEIDPGEGLIWRCDCTRKAGEGQGGILIIIWYR